MPHDPDRWYQRQVDAAAMLGVSPRVIRDMILAGDLETIMVGKTRYVLTRSIRAFEARVGLDREHEANGSVA